MRPALGFLTAGMLPLISGSWLWTEDVPVVAEPMGAVTTFDPFRGLDQDGRIPDAKPAGLPDAERWRYIPEGRIKPGSPWERLYVSTFVAPIFFYEEAIGAGAGVAYTDIDFREQRRREFLGMFVAWTTEGQESYTGVWQRWLDFQEVPGGGVIIDERSYLRCIAGYERTRTRRFFGIGSDTTADDETSYTDEVSQANVRSEYALPHAWVVGAGVGGEHRNLAAGYLSGVPTTGDQHPGLVAAGDRITQGWVAGSLRYDTRDSPEVPYHGWSLGVEWQGPVATTYRAHGGVATMRGTLTVPLPGIFHAGGVGAEENPPTDTLAFGASTSAAHGDLPFWALPSLGGSNTLRGYLADRFTDRAAWNAAVEWRLWVIPRGYAFTDSIRIERLGLAPFVDVGSVADNPGAFDEAQVRHSIGIGFRAMFERNAVFRLDIARSPEQVGVNFDFGMAF